MFFKSRHTTCCTGIIKTVSLLVICLTPSLPTLANETDDLFFDMPVVLSASRLEQPVSETPIAVTSIDREIIEASGARTIPEVLRLVPGIIIGNSVNEWGEEPKLIVTYHGHTDQYSKQMQVLIDGRSIYEPLLGGVNWNMLPINIEDIERIEVSRGPNAATYGSNSFLAVINIITRNASEDPGHYTMLRAGNHNIRDFTYRYGGSNGEIDYRITLSAQNDDGLDAKKNISTYNANGDNLTFQYADEFEDNHDDLGTGAIDYRIDTQLDNNSHLTYQGSYSKTEQSINKNSTPDGITPVRVGHTTSAHQYVKLENTINDKNSFVVQYYYNLLNKEDQSLSDTITFPVIDPFTLNLDFGFKSERHNLEFTQFTQTTDDLRLIWGLSAQQDISKSTRWLNNQGTVKRELFRVFGNGEWQVNKNNILNFGALIEKNKTQGINTSPRLALIHKLNEKHSLRFGVSRAIRSPFINEEFGNSLLTHEPTIGGTSIGTTLIDQQLIPNNKLVHETIISREIGYYGQFIDDKLLFNARIFRDNLNNLIHLRDIPADNDNIPGDGKTDIHLNLAATQITGMELELDLRPDESLRFIGSATYLNIKSKDIPFDPKNLLSEEYENSAPKLSASLISIKRFNDQYSGSLALYHVGQMEWLDVPGTPKSYTTGDLKISKLSRNNNSLSKLSLILKNILGDYSSYHTRPRFGPLAVHNLTGYIEYSIQFK